MLIRFDSLWGDVHGHEVHDAPAVVLVFLREVASGATLENLIHQVGESVASGWSFEESYDGTEIVVGSDRSTISEMYNPELMPPATLRTSVLLELLEAKFSFDERGQPIEWRG